MNKVQFAARLLMVESMASMARANLLLDEFDDLAKSLEILRAGAILLGAQEVSAEYFLAAEPRKPRTATKGRDAKRAVSTVGAQRKK